jgi:hypothetical protein
MAWHRAIDMRNRDARAPMEEEREHAVLLRAFDTCAHLWRREREACAVG